MQEVVREFFCKTCKGALEIEAEKSEEVGTCPYCGNRYTLPKKTTLPTALDLISKAQADMNDCKFAEAYAKFMRASEEDDSEPEAYFGMAVASCKVQYLKDEVENCWRPICYDTANTCFCDDKNYRRALELSDGEKREEYERRGNEIDAVREKFYNLRKSGTEYDVFICVKVTGEDGKHTRDYEMANAIYDDLKDKGYRPFFSERILKQVTGTDYEAHILYALNSAECMIIVCCNKDYLDTKWVKNEYARYMEMIAAKTKAADSLTFVFSGAPVESLPGYSQKIQGIDYNSFGASSKIERYVNEHTPASRKRKEEEEAKRRMEEEQRRRDREAMDSMRQELHSITSAWNSGSGERAPIFDGEHFKSLVKNKNYSEAAKYFEKAPQGSITDPDVLFYAAVCLLEGRKAFLAPRDKIDKAVRYLNEAIAMSGKGIYYYFLAYIKYDYFERKYLNTSPNYRQLYQAAANKGVTNGEANALYALLGVARPSCL